jgi:hypothetical protein
VQLTDSAADGRRQIISIGATDKYDRLVASEESGPLVVSLLVRTK